MRRALPALLFATLFAFACLRAGPSLGGKLCKPGSGECGGGFACVSKNASGQPLDLPTPGGICEVSPLDCDPHSVDCPGDGGFWICSKQSGAATCYATGDADLAGSLCMVDRGVCRTYGVFSPADGGQCLTPAGDPHAAATSECWDAGGAGILCPCDNLDQNCDGAVDDFDPASYDNSPLAPAVDLVPSGGGCAVGSAWVLEPGAQAVSLTDGGPQVDTCARLSLTHAYSLSDVAALTTGPVVTGSCGGNASAGTAGTLLLFGARELDGGYTMLGSASTSNGNAHFALPSTGPWRSLLVCLPVADGGTPFKLTGVGLTRKLSAPSQCDAE